MLAGDVPRAHGRRRHSGLQRGGQDRGDRPIGSGLRRSRHRRRRRQPRRDRGDRPARGAGAARAGRGIVHARNRGVGAAITTGYARALELGAQATAVMAGDGQMDPADLPRLLAPVIDGEADYAKGNRFAWPGGWRAMPAVRLIGGGLLSLADAARVGVLAHRRFAMRVHGRVASRAARDRVATAVPALRLPERSAREARRGARARRRRSGAARLRSGLAFGVASARASRCRSRGCCARGFFRRLRARWRGAPRHRAAPVAVDERRGARAMRIGLLTTSFPRHAGDYAGSFVGDRAAAAARGRSRGRRAGGRRWRRRAARSARAVDRHRIAVASTRSVRRRERACFTARARPRRWSAAARASGSRRRVSRRARGRGARARASLGRRSSRTGWFRARSPRSRPRQRTASARSRTRATSRCWNGSRSGAPSRAAWPATGSTIRFVSADAAGAVRGAGRRGSRRHRRADGGARAPLFATRGAPTSPAGARSASRGRPCSRSAGWSRSRATSGSCARARRRSERASAGASAGGGDPGRRARARPPRPARRRARVRLRLPGFVPRDEVGGWLRAADVFVHPRSGWRTAGRKGRRSRPPRRARSGFRCSSTSDVEPPGGRPRVADFTRTSTGV